VLLPFDGDSQSLTPVLCPLSSFTSLSRQRSIESLSALVHGTIPCAIWAKVEYGDILANIDWLHGPAESLLTVTNLLIVIGMREGLREAREANGGGGGGDGATGRGLSSVGGRACRSLLSMSEGVI
jgi:hypothetical protein